MDKTTQQRILKLLEGFPADRQIKIIRAAKVIARIRSEETKHAHSQ